METPAHLTGCPTEEKKGTVDGTNNNLKFTCKELSYDVTVTVIGLEESLVITNQREDKKATRDNPTVTFKNYVFGQTPNLIIPKDYEINGAKVDNQSYQDCNFVDSNNNIIKDPATQIGSVAAGKFTHPNILCVDKKFYVSGDVENLKGKLIITNNDVNNETGLLSQDIVLEPGVKTDYKFEGYTYPNSYALDFIKQPEHQTCAFTKAKGDFKTGQTGTIGYSNGNIVNNKITCVDKTYSILGYVRDYTSTGLVLSDKKVSLNITSTKLNFAFDKEKYKADEEYEIFVLKQPTDQKCRVTNGKGVVKGDTSGIEVICTDDLSADGFDAGIAKGIHLKVPVVVSSKNPDVDVCKGVIEWGDGLSTPFSTCFNQKEFTHEYTKEGNFLVRVKVSEPTTIRGEVTIDVPVRKSQQCVVPGPNGQDIDGFMDSFEAVIP